MAANAHMRAERMHKGPSRPSVTPPDERAGCPGIVFRHAHSKTMLPFTSSKQSYGRGGEGEGGGTIGREPQGLRPLACGLHASADMLLCKGPATPPNRTLPATHFSLAFILLSLFTRLMHIPNHANLCMHSLPAPCPC